MVSQKKVEYYVYIFDLWNVLFTLKMILGNWTVA